MGAGDNKTLPDAALGRANAVIRADENMPTEQGTPLGWVDATALALAHDVVALAVALEAAEADASGLRETIRGMLDYDHRQMYETGLEPEHPCEHERRAIAAEARVVAVEAALREAAEELPVSDSRVARHAVLQRLHFKIIALLGGSDPGEFVRIGYWQEEAIAAAALEAENAELKGLKAGGDRVARAEVGRLTEALERTDQSLRASLAGRPIRDADEVLAGNAFLLFASPIDPAAAVRPQTDTPEPPCEGCENPGTVACSDADGDHFFLCADCALAARCDTYEEALRAKTEEAHKKVREIGPHAKGADELGLCYWQGRRDALESLAVLASSVKQEKGEGLGGQRSALTRAQGSRELLCEEAAEDGLPPDAIRPRPYYGPPMPQPPNGGDS